MCAQEKKTINPAILFGIAIVLGLFTGYFQIEWMNSFAEAISQVFINLLKLVSLPIIFLSIVSTAAGMENFQQIKLLGKKVLKYTLLTTLLAASLALILFTNINPVQEHAQLAPSIIATTDHAQSSYLTFLLQIVPSNLVQPFSENNVIGVLFLALLFSFAVISLPVQPRAVLHSFFSSLYSAIIMITRWIVNVMPIAVWAFIVLFMRDFQKGLDIKSLSLYLTCVVAANLIQALVILPLLLKFKGIRPLPVLKAMFPALSVAFFTKSSAAALPMAMRCAEENAGVSRKVASFSLPLCTTINMNACAAFILITVLFVSMSEGIVYTPLEMGLWIILATVAAIGNAGVPMGCYFLASAFLATMNIPLNLLGVILPFYTLIDMLESSINVWSDSCVTVIVDKEIKEEQGAGLHTCDHVNENLAANQI